MEENNTLPKSRPVFLYVLCALSVISNIVLIFISLFLLIRGKADSFLDSIPVTDIISEELKHGNALYYILKIGIHIFCLVSLVFIMKQKKKGLFFYISGQILLIGLSWLFLRSLGLYYLAMGSVITFIFSLFFILLFWLYFPKNLKQG